MSAKEHHRIFRSGWLRAAVLGANDGIISTACLMTGIAAANCGYYSIMSAGLSGLIAGALSMAVGEYVSVKSQSDIESADLQMEQHSLKKNHDDELEELAQIYINRGLSNRLAKEVAIELTNHDALDAHARDELGISLHNRAKPLQAAFASAVSFAIGEMVPLAVSLFAPIELFIPTIIISSVFSLGVLGAISAKTGGANIWPAVKRITILGAISMLFVSSTGSLFGVIGN
ncbi:Nodulin-21-like protein [Candidatus Kinetoplastibacterium oncopeltii TCC290E]|uniref:Nodulin-21-like protein n=1 Tax=Candidatus Kinetoplastidibacterium stringomonadis TCC290E TaxID=1208920 RepID=M1M8K7_9PROT|nr:VIT family protein [Candidatus Kinetoplastibacterium oncopeltii]AGF48335.1 Nodulin-21-like protein [Candidatus Kinetoplastibacterium oncopeltii TCC290E]